MKTTNDCQEFIKEVKENLFYLHRVNNDVNGNPRYVAHFSIFLKDSEKNCSVNEQFNKAAHRAACLGWKKYRGKDFGGGFVKQSYNVNQDLANVFNCIHKF